MHGLPSDFLRTTTNPIHYTSFLFIQHSSSSSAGASNRVAINHTARIMNTVDSSISLANPASATSTQNLSQNGRSPVSAHMNHHPALAYQDVASRTPVQMISNNHHITSVHHESGSSPGTLIQKRPPGRPKGTTKKHFMPIEEKVKRPVGRPRKDGLPAGSVPKRPKIIGKPPGRPRKNSTSDVDTLTMDVSMMAEYGGVRL